MQRLQPFSHGPRASFDICSTEEYEAAPKLDLTALNAAARAAAARVAAAFSLRLVATLLAFSLRLS